MPLVHEIAIHTSVQCMSKLVNSLWIFYDLAAWVGFPAPSVLPIPLQNLQNLSRFIRYFPNKQMFCRFGIISYQTRISIKTNDWCCSDRNAKSGSLKLIWYVDIHPSPFYNFFCCKDGIGRRSWEIRWPKDKNRASIFLGPIIVFLAGLTKRRYRLGFNWYKCDAFELALGCWDS